MRRKQGQARRGRVGKASDNLIIDVLREKTRRAFFISLRGAVWQREL